MLRVRVRVGRARARARAVGLGLRTIRLCCSQTQAVQGYCPKSSRLESRGKQIGGTLSGGTCYGLSAVHYKGVHL